MNRYFFLIVLLVMPAFFSSGIVTGAENGGIDLATVGYLQIQVPVDGARVYLDQVFMGFIQNGAITIPIDVMATPRYSNLIIEYTGYQTYLGPVPALVPEKTVTVLVNLNKTGYERMGIISFESGLAGAELYLDGVKKGVTPDSGNLQIQTVPVGLYEFTVKRAGNLSITQQQYVSSNAVTVYRVKLEPATTGDVHINSTPEGAGVYLNNRNAGLTPLTIPNVPVGNLTLKITKEGYQDWGSEVSVVGAEPSQVDAVLVSLPPTPTPTCPDVTPSPEPVQPQENSSILYGVFILVVVLVLCCVLIGVWAFRKQKP
ncbi:PEGA domain-containing protein [Methanospirillum sp.]|uniref:PEGA domain-containing protein n=1 Tax=Methanospirillum sp. TaxID=45200 RepID=UPI002D81060D|nr:PEGA domain-containing protein [Methanospirillum sp.]